MQRYEQARHFRDNANALPIRFQAPPELRPERRPVRVGAAAPG
jgi:hypothetical protein